MRRRRSIRLADYDYSQAGAYFVTICTQKQACLFGEITDHGQIFTESGRMIETVWEDLPTRFPHIGLDEFVVMPNHFHGIIVIHETNHRRGESGIRPYTRGDHKDRPYGGGMNHGRNVKFNHMNDPGGRMWIRWDASSRHSNRLRPWNISKA